MIFSILSSICEATSEVLCPVLDFSAQERHGHTGKSSSHSHIPTLNIYVQKFEHPIKSVFLTPYYARHFPEDKLNFCSKQQ